jgi:uncharacterized protein YkwD
MIANVLICASVMFLGGEPAAAKAPAPEKVQLLAIEENIVAFTNFERARYGLPALEVDAAMMRSARQHATWMTQNQCMVHSNQPVAENIAMGQPNTQEVMQCWMASPGHRANILGGYRRLGVAAYRTEAGTIYWCQQFLP